MRIWSCDHCGAAIRRGKDLRLLKVFMASDDEGAPLIGLKVRGRSVLHLCVECYEGVVVGSVLGEEEASA